MSNWRTTSCCLIKAKKKQCLTTLPKEDQAMIHLETERAYRLKRWNESDDHSQSHPVHHHQTTRSDNKDILDGFLSKMDETEKHLDEAVTEAKRRADEVHANTWSSMAELHQCVKAWKDRHSQRDVETSCLWDSWSQTHHTRDDRPRPSHKKDSCPTREGHEQDGQVHHPFNEPDNRSHRSSPPYIQRHIVLDEETLVDVMAKSCQKAKCWEWSENDAAKHHREALNCVIQAAVEVVQFAKDNNLLSQEVIDAANELTKAVQAKNSRYWVQKLGLNAEAHITSQTTRPVEPMFNHMMNIGDTRVDVE